MNEQSQQPTLPEAFPPAQELAVWLRALQSFFSAANHPFTEAERASLGERSFKCETGVARDALVRCLHLLTSLTRGDALAALEGAAGLPVVGGGTRSAEGALGLAGAKESLADLSDVFKDVSRLCDALLESTAVGFAAWSSLGSVLERELKRSESAALIQAAGHAARAAELQDPLVALAHGLEQDDLGEDVLEIFQAFSRLLALLRFVELSLRSDAQLKRLRRIEGQVRGLQRQVESDTYCIDVLTQVSAATRALEAFALSLLEEHLKHCVADAVQAGGVEADAKVKEASAAIARLVRS